MYPFNSMKKINFILRKCKSLSRQLGRSSSYSSLRSKSTKDHEPWSRHDHHHQLQQDENCVTIFVGSTRKRYVISSKYLNHPLLNALTEKSKQKNGELILVKCEVVLFDHLLWMLENSEPNLILDSLEELASLYAL
ncbi:auxin-responsive protein SAUR78 [Mangifera indica]|uniref:auxin-responsive protein SAUR78 n=1 Tax=Mangifera indica TaxID=29780 RepID=UPI001CF9926B|nr:auxin-responsive protein SAUR78 [Mangifera indica]